MSKSKKIFLGIGLVIITTVSWIVSSCTRIVTVTAPVEYPRDNSPPGTSLTMPAEPSALPSTTNETPPLTTPATTTDFPPLFGNAPVPTEIPAAVATVYDIDIKSYKLAVTGIVNYPMSLTYEQIQSYPTVTEKLEIVCPDTEDEWDEWTGVPVQTLLEEAGLTPGASEVIFTGIDGYYKQLPIDFVFRNKLFLAYQMNGQTLPRERGYPLRLVTPGNLGADWPRWITKIEVKPALTTFSSSAAIIQKLSQNIPTAGGKLCSCLLVRLSAPASPEDYKLL
jgi:DMSO/TMAO reductase YedYZ molybdopterin-dependent catalytic subunit